MRAGARARRAATSWAACLALLALSPADAKQCNGRFECSDFGYEDDGLSHYASGSGGFQCTYGHTEKDGSCETPCQGVRHGTCRCRSKEEAEEAVLEQAWVFLGITAPLTALSLAFVSYAFYKRKTRAARVAEEAQEEEEQEQAQTAEEAGQVNMDATQEAPKATEVQATVVQATAVGEPTVVQATVLGASDAPERGVSSSGRLARSASRLVVANPTKANLFQGLFAVGVPLFLVGMWAQQALESNMGIFDDYSLFIGLVAIAAYFTTFAGVVLWRVQKGGLQNFVDSARANPLGIFTAVYRSINWAVPVVGVAGLIWIFSRISNPEGVYKGC